MQGHADAFFHLGIMHLHGWGVPASLQQAQNHLNMAGSLGHLLAEYNLALILLDSRQASFLSACVKDLLQLKQFSLVQQHCELG